VAKPLRFAALLRYGVAAAFLATGLLLIVGSQFAARAAGDPATAAGAVPTVPLTDNPLCDDDDDDPVDCFGPVGQLASLFGEENQIAPDPRDADLGGVAATGVLLMSIGGAVVASTAGGLAGLAGAGAGAGGGAGGAGGAGTAGGGGGVSGGGAGAAAGQATPGGHGVLTPFHAPTGAAAGVTANATALGVVPAVSGLNVPVPRPELIQGGLSIFRSMKRVTDKADPTGYSPGDVAQLFGDAAGIAALASVLAPGIGLISIATGGAAAASDVKPPVEIFEQMRRNFGRLGYMQGVVDENVSHADHDLGDLDPAAPDAAASAPPPRDPTTLSAAQLKTARTLWAGKADAAFDALARAQQELDDLDDRRSNLAHQIDAIGDLLGRIDAAGSVGLPQYLADTISYGRGWHFAGDSSKMAAALRQSFEQSRAAGVAHPRRVTGKTPPPQADAAAGPTAMTLAQWAARNKVADGRLGVMEALAGLERWRGYYDALAGAVGVEINRLRLQADVAVAARRDLAAEVQRRALQGKSK
jgi:hypothetical protein